MVDSGALVHMISRKDLICAGLETLTTLRSPTTVLTANGEVQTHEEATVNVKELDTFLTMKILEDTPAVLSPGQFFDENVYSYEWINGQKPHLSKNGIRIQYNTENCRSDRGSWFINEVLPLACILQHPWTPPTMTSLTLSSESVARQER